MGIVKMIAIGFIVVGALGLAYGGFTYTKDTHKAELGSLQVSIEDNEYVNVPVWAGIAAIVLGGMLLLIPPKN